MRGVVISVVVVGTLLIGVQPAFAEPCFENEYGQIVCADSMVETSAGAPAGGNGETPSEPNPNVGRRLMYEVFDNDPENFCARVVYEDYGDPALAAAANASSAGTLQEIQGMGGRVCPGTEGGAVVLPSPEQVALSYRELAQPPAPEPWIAPGRAITGLPAYLESGGRRAQDFPFDTVLGPLRISAAFSHLTVDWGDGSGPRRYADGDLGGPYPDGGISWVYTDVGVVDVTVVQHWTVTWSVGGESGTFEDVTSQASIPAFEVGQVQAVLG